MEIAQVYVSLARIGICTQKLVKISVLSVIPIGGQFLFMGRAGASVLIAYSCFYFAV